jgi:hypothetical protein
VNKLDQAETIGPIRAFVFDDIHALLNEMQTESARLYFFKSAHTKMCFFNGGSAIAEQEFEAFGKLRAVLAVDRPDEYFYRLIRPTFVRVANDIGQRFVDSAGDRPAVFRGESEGLRQALHGAAHGTEEAGIAGQLHPQERGATQVAIALLRFRSPRWMKRFHLKLSYAAGTASCLERTHFQTLNIFCER